MPNLGSSGNLNPSNQLVQSGHNIIHCIFFTCISEGVSCIYHVNVKHWPMETETVKLLKALPNMLQKVMPMVVVATKYSQGKKDLGDPYTMVPFGFEFGF